MKNPTEQQIDDAIASSMVHRTNNFDYKILWHLKTGRFSKTAIHVTLNKALIEFKDMVAKELEMYP